MAEGISIIQQTIQQSTFRGRIQTCGCATCTYYIRVALLLYIVYTILECACMHVGIPRHTLRLVLHPPLPPLGSTRLLPLSLPPRCTSFTGAAPFSAARRFVHVDWAHGCSMSIYMRARAATCTRGLPRRRGFGSDRGVSKAWLTS